MAISEFEIKRYEKIVGEYIEKCRPSQHVRNQVDLSFRIEGQSVVIFEIREDNKGEYIHLVTLWRSTRQERNLYGKGQ